MFESKFTILIVLTLIVCLLLVGYYAISNNFSELNSEIYENSDDTVMMQILDENGNVQLVPVTNTYAEGQATS